MRYLALLLLAFNAYANPYVCVDQFANKAEYDATPVAVDLLVDYQKFNITVGGWQSTLTISGPAYYVYTSDAMFLATWNLDATATVILLPFNGHPWFFQCKSAS
jgi:hypothetical protein